MAKDKLLYDDIIDKSVKEGIDTLKKSMNELYESFKKLTEQSVKNSTSTKDAASSTKKLSDEQRRINEEEKRAEKIARDLKNTREKLNKSYIAAQEQVRKRRAAILEEIRAENQASDSLAKKEALLRKLTQQYRNASSVVARQMAPEIKKLKTEINNLNGAIGNNTGRVGSYFKSFVQGAASMATMYVSFQGFTRLIRSTFGIMTSFEKTMSGVAAISGATGTELQKLEDDAKRLGATTSKTATEVAQLQVEYAKLGFTTQEILNATEATVLLSQATREDLARSAEVAGATIRGFGMDASESSRVVDVMAASFTSSALNLERFAEAMKYVAPVAKASGITLEQTAAMMSKLADAGIHGSMAGTALRQIMLEMAKAGKTGMQGFNEMAKAGLSLADANDEVGQRAATALLILSENEKAVNNLTESYNNAEGAAKKMADTQMDNLSGAITILSSAWEGLVLKLTEGDGVLRKIVDGLASFLQFLTRNGRIIVNVAKAIATLTTAFLAYRTAIFLTNTQVGIHIASLISKNAVLSLSTIRTYALAKAQAALNAIMKLNPFALVASALAAVTMAMAMQTEEVKLLYDELGRTNEEYEKMYENLTEIEKVQKKIKDIAGEGLEIGQLDVAKETLRIYKEAWDNGLSRIESERGAILITEDLIKGQEKRVAELELQLNELKTKQTEIKKEEIKKENEHTKKLAEEHIKRIEQQRDFRTSELKLWGAGQSAIFAS
ncbi:MAG: phage tail tape measure protein, partial [Candidatus Riflebacteria bacterium]|nr:phage tail tape measure protein [Candidatus Riflebacteria bacterium]